MAKQPKKSAPAGPREIELLKLARVTVVGEGGSIPRYCAAGDQVTVAADEAAFHVGRNRAKYVGRAGKPVATAVE